MTSNKSRTTINLGASAQTPRSKKGIARVGTNGLLVPFVALQYNSHRLGIDAKLSIPQNFSEVEVVQLFWIVKQLSQVRISAYGNSRRQCSGNMTKLQPPATFAMTNLDKSSNQRDQKNDSCLRVDGEITE